MAVLNLSGVLAVKSVSKTIASGAITGVTGGALIVITSETGTADTLDTMQFDATELAQVSSLHYPVVYLQAASGHTITVTDDHAALSAFQFALKNGANLALSDQHAAPFMYIGGSWYDVTALPQLDGGVIDANTAQTLSSKTFTSITLQGIVGSYSGSSETHDEAGATTTDATTTNLIAVTVNEGDSIILRCALIAHKNDQSASLGGTLEIKARRATAGNVTLVGTVSTTIESDTTSTATADVDTGTQTVRVRITGVAAETWIWVGSYTYHKVRSAA